MLERILMRISIAQGVAVLAWNTSRDTTSGPGSNAHEQLSRESAHHGDQLGEAVIRSIVMSPSTVTRAGHVDHESSFLARARQDLAFVDRQ